MMTAMPEIKPRPRWRVARIAMYGALTLGVAWALFVAVTEIRVARTFGAIRQDGFQTNLSELSPPFASAEENGAWLYTAACAVRRSKGYVSVSLRPHLRDLSSAEREALNLAAKDNQAALALLHEARLKPTCSFRRNYAAASAFQPDVPEFGPSMILASLLSYEAQVLAASGDHAQARERACDLFALADAFRHDPNALSQLARLNIAMTGVDLVRECTAVAESRDLEEWLKTLPPPEQFGTVEFALRAELARLTTAVRAPISYLTSHDNEGPISGTVNYVFVAPLFKAYSVDSLQRLHRLVRVAGRPYPDLKAELDALFPESICGGRRDFDLVDVNLSARTLIRDHAVAVAALAVARAGVQVEILRARDGVYPAAVDVADPFGGGPLVLQGGVIRSVGPTGYTSNRELLEWTLRR